MNETAEGAADSSGRIRKTELEPEKEPQKKERDAVYYRIKLKHGAESQSVHFTKLQPPPLGQRGAVEPFLCRSPKCRTKDGPAQECTKCEESAAERERERKKKGSWGGRGHKEST